MKNIVALLALAAIAVAYEDLDYTYYYNLLEDLKAYRDVLTCLVDKGPCNNFGSHAKEHVGESLRDGCNECDIPRKHFTHLLLLTAKDKLPELYEQLKAKYDPENKLFDALFKTMEKY